MTLTDTARPLKSNTYVATSNRGVDEWGLYFEWVELLSDLQTIYKYCRVFVAGTHVSFYERQAETARTTWKPFNKPTPEAARAYAQKLLTRRSHNVLRGSPVLVQLEPADVTQIKNGKSPAARYRATLRHQALFGVLETEQDASPLGFDYSGVEKAIEAIGKAAPAAVLPPPSGAPVVPVLTAEVPTEPSKATTLTEPINWTAVTDKEPY